ncbi:hypothetical protein C8R41DRAFT_858310 [Lentinula lateritia]|uniref:Uncharacterized protein n=1 Tax=Lentinula lateritia TaxID=40482 RepID=A0ABQ8V496_9AGAR|nr:hypothetical protein C8R41DRAFT_858310 [Lentinula lateritia]
MRTEVGNSSKVHIFLSWFDLGILQIGWVRVIFSLPTRNLGTLFPKSITPPSHLAHVEWFTKFSQKPEPHTGLYRANPQLCKDGSRAIEDQIL